MSETPSIPDDTQIKARFISEIAKRLSIGRMDENTAQSYLSKLKSTAEEIQAALAEVITIDDRKPINKPEEKDKASIPEQTTSKETYSTYDSESDGLILSNPSTRILEELTATEIEITKSTPYVLLNIDLISHLLDKANITIPPEGMARMKLALETADFSSTPELINIIINETENERPPLVMITPARISLEGEEVRMTTKTLYQVVKILQREGVWKGVLTIDPQAFNDTENQPLHMKQDSTLRIYTTTALKGSKELVLLKQFEHQDNIFDDYRLARNYNLDLSLAWALLLWELQENEHPQIQPFTIRLNNQNRKPPIYLDYRPGKITILCPEKAKERPVCGMGASCIIPVKIEEEI